MLDSLALSCIVSCAQGKAPQKAFSFRGMTSKLFGQENAETRESRVKLLDDQIVEAEDGVDKAQKAIEWVDQSVESPVFRDTKNWENSRNLGRKWNSQNFTENTIFNAKYFEIKIGSKKQTHKNKAKTNKTKHCMCRKSGSNLLHSCQLLVIF